MSLEIIKSSPERSVSLTSIFTKKNKTPHKPTIKSDQPKYKVKSSLYYNIPSFKGFKFTTKYVTLGDAFKYINDQIILRASQEVTSDLSVTDQELLKKFQDKFMLIKDEWTSMMSIMHRIICVLDKEYSSHQYFGFKNAIYYHIINISLSFILLGPNAIIDNVIAEKIKSLYPDDKVISDDITLSQVIRIFWLQIPIVMSKIFDLQSQIMHLDAEHTKMLQYDSTLRSNIQILRQKIKSQSQLITNLDDQEILTQNQSNLGCLKQVIFQQDYYETKIKHIILEKQKILEQIQNEFNNVSSFICFNYFTHDDWLPLLDEGLLPER